MKKITRFLLTYVPAIFVMYCVFAACWYNTATNAAIDSDLTDAAISETMHDFGFNLEWHEEATTSDILCAPIISIFQ